jgi:hypothetical protein
LKNKNPYWGGLPLPLAIYVRMAHFTLNTYQVCSPPARLPLNKKKVEYEEKEMADYRFCHSAVEYEGLI